MTDTQLERDAIALLEAMFDVAEEERDAWVEARTEGRPDLRERVTAMRTADRIVSLQTGSAAAGLAEEEPPERIGAYRIVDLIGRGGMGSVYRGERATGDFRHAVAIKIIKSGLLSEALVDRFQRERQTLASLSHPNIAQLYDGGETESGSPYIVMELVDGLPVLQWADEQALPVAARRQLFRDVCAAVSFAHRNLVVHRDLTPSNVLVTRDGTVKLIDFGIAKPADGAGGASATPSIGSLSLTPGYAAPERMTTTEVTTAADIYSLGKLLEKLIPSNDGELRAIVARATATLPQDRYASADALGADVAAWGDDIPVAAVGGGRRYVARKFVARHSIGVVAAAVATLLLIGALGATLFANARASAARVDAERRFDQTRAIAKTMMFDAFDEVSKVSGSTKSRELLAQSGLTYIDALASDADAPLDVRLEAGRGYTRLAKVMGGGQAGQLGKAESSNALLARADAILRPLYAARPENPQVRRDFADLLLEQAGTNLYNNNEVALARKQAVEAQGVIGPIARNDADSARLYAVAVQTEADSYGWDDDYTKAQPIFLRAEAFIAGLPAAMRDDAGVMGARSANLRLLAEAHHKLKQEAAAEAALDQAVTINRALVARQTDDPRTIRKLALSLWYRAVVLRTNGKNEPARASIAEAVANARLLLARDPNDAGAVKLFGTVGEVQAQVLADMKRFPASFAMSDEVVRAYRRLIAVGGNTSGESRSLATVLSTRGGNFYNGGAYALACGTWRESLDMFVRLETNGKLTGLDRNNAMPELRNYLKRNCDGGAPRAGMGRSLDP